MVSKEVNQFSLHRGRGGGHIERAIKYHHEINFPGGRKQHSKTHPKRFKLYQKIHS